jgi:hypothetical protein
VIGHSCSDGYITYVLDRLGMHLLFYGHEQAEIMETKRVENLLREQSIKVIFAIYTIARNP